jgi:hypothetical protein
MFTGTLKGGIKMQFHKFDRRAISSVTPAVTEIIKDREALASAYKAMTEVDREIKKAEKSLRVTKHKIYLEMKAMRKAFTADNYFAMQTCTVKIGDLLNESSVIGEQIIGYKLKRGF